MTGQAASPTEERKYLRANWASPYGSVQTQWNVCSLARSYRQRRRKQCGDAVQHCDADALAGSCPDDRKDRPSGGEEPVGARAGTAAHTERGWYPAPQTPRLEPRTLAGSPDTRSLVTTL